MEQLMGQILRKMANHRRRSIRRGAFGEDQVKKFPWLEDSDDEIAKPSAARVGGSGGSGASSSKGPRAGDELPSVSDSELADVFKELQAIRDNWEHELKDDDIPDFRGSVLGGRTAKGKIGKSCDAFQGHASNQDSVAWCMLARLQHAARFDLSAYGGERGACIMVRAWMHRMQYMYTHHVEGDAAMGFDCDVLVGYDEPEEFTELALGLKGQAAKMAQWIRDLTPKF